MCYYCGCNTTITKNQDKAEKYLEHLKEEMRLVCSYLPHRRQVGQLHFGGGTPTFLNNEQFSDIMNGIHSYFQLTESAEVSVEIDPRVTSREQVYHLKNLGFNRISMGVQDFTKKVQEAIHRIQSRECVEELTSAAKECGFQSINFDLIYGLPHQTIENFHDTAKAVCVLRPDRIALFGYAHVPWKKTQQKKIDSSELPSPVERLGLLLHTTNL